MSSSIPFTGAGFRVVGAAALGLSKVRINFSSDPQQSDPVGANDGLNPSNYSLSGPGAVAVSSVAIVSGDPESLDLTISAELATGYWTVTAGDIRTPDNTLLGYPVFASFTVSTGVDLTSLTAGAEVDSAVRIIKKHLSPAMAGPNWDALIEGLSQGDDINWDNARLAFDQLFIGSSSGKYLDRQAANVGITRPEDTGISDEKYRQLVIRLTNSKVTLESLREVLETFYGVDALRAGASTELDAPFSLAAGLDLRVLIDETQEIDIVFSASDFTSIGGATGIELAGVLTSAFRTNASKAWAEVLQNPTTGGDLVRIYSPSLGLKSFVKILGGSAQPFLQFPRYRQTYNGTIVPALALSWTYSNPEPGTTELTMTTAGVPFIDISSVEPGDYVVIANGVTDGQYEVLDVSYSWSGGNYTQNLILDGEVLDITNNPPDPYTGGLTQQSNEDYSFFSAERQTILNGDRTVVVAQSQRGAVDIQVPATTAIVNRSPGTGSYVRAGEELDIQRLVRDVDGVVMLDLATAPVPVLAVGDQVLLQGLKSPGLLPYVTAGLPATYPAVADSSGSYRTCKSITQVPPSDVTEYGTGLLLSSGDVLMVGGRKMADANLGAELPDCNRFRLGAKTAVVDDSEAWGSNYWKYQWVATADLNTARIAPVLSELPNGQVLASGGWTFDVYAILDSTELYDPVGNTWTPAAVMATARLGHQQTVLQSGQVLVTGGHDGVGTVVSGSEVYDAGTGLFTATASMSAARFRHQAVLLPDGRVFAIGGSIERDTNALDTVSDTTEFWDPNTGLWTPGPPMATARSFFGAAVLPDGRVWVGGGYGKDRTHSGNNAPLKTCEIYDPGTGRWHPTSNLLVALYGFNTQLLSDGRILIAAGYTNISETNANRSTGIYFASSSDLRWKLSPLVNTGHRDFVAAAGDDVMLFSGGNNNTATYTVAMLLIPAADASSAVGLNDQLPVTSVVSPTRVLLQTAPGSYCSNWGPEDGVVASTAQRTSNVTAINIGADAATFSVGDIIFFNSNSTDFSSDLMTLTAIGATTVSFADPGADTGVVSIGTSVGTRQSPDFKVSRVRAGAQPVADPGPYIFDPDSGLAVTGIEDTLTEAILEGLQVDRLKINSNTDFPDGQGWLVLDFGTSNQSEPIKYLETIGTNLLLLDFRWRPASDYGVGATVTLLSSRTPFQPSATELTGNLYATGASAGRVAAETMTEAAAAAGITLNFKTIYPGDRGLGAEGNLTDGDGKLSDIVDVFGA